MEAIVDTIHYSLAENPPRKNYTPIKLNNSKLFAGYIIKNEYDEQRIEISRKLKPTRFSFLTNSGDYKLYGLIKDSDASFLTYLQNKRFNNVMEYSSYLTLQGMSCLTCFLHFAPGLYPIDSSYMGNYFPEINFENLNKKKNISDFQKVAHIYFFALVNCIK